MRGATPAFWQSKGWVIPSPERCYCAAETSGFARPMLALAHGVSSGLIISSKTEVKPHRATMRIELGHLSSMGVIQFGF